MKKRDKGIEAYFTIEASLILLMVISCVVFVVCFLLFWYNRCIMEQDLNLIAVRAAQSNSKSMEELEVVISSWQSEYMTDKYYAWSAEDKVISLQKNWYDLRQTGKLLLGNRVWKAQVSGKAMRIDPATFLRLCRRSLT